MSQQNQPGPPTPATYSVRVLGCKVNQYEARQIERILERRGLRPAPEGCAADVAVIHTCAVTSAAMRKSAQWLRAARAAAAGGSRVIATGCAGAAGLSAARAGADAVVPAGPDWAGGFEAALDRMLGPSDAARDAAPEAPGGPPIERFSGHTRAFLKIQDGCDLRCSYCIVPSLRGAPRDKPLDELLAEARALVRAGHIEIVVTGVSVGLWGRGSGGLARVLRELARIEGLARIRMSSLHPAELTPDLLDAWAATPAMLPHVHLPLQSGSDEVLARMNRGYTAAEFLDAVGRARAALDRPSFTTDLIVGFPGETDADFERTLEACRAACFVRMHVFPFSARPGTPAAAMRGSVAPARVRERVRAVNALGPELFRRFTQPLLGGIEEVLCETVGPDGKGEGYTGRYLPVRFAAGPEMRNRVVPVRLDRIEGATIAGTAVRA